jgi:hypothetical protein
LEKAQGTLDPKQMGEAMKDLGRLTEKAAAESNELSEELAKDAKEALDQGLSPEQLQDLSKALGRCKACERAKIEKLVKAKLIDPAQLGRLELVEKGEKPGEGDLALIPGLDGEEGMDGIEAFSEAPSPDGDGLPGRGGVNRGGGDAAMTWKDPASREKVGFKEQVLSPGAAASLKESRLAGVSVGDPKAAKSGGGSTGGVLSSAQAGAGAAHAQIILPEHEKTVRRYFDREKSKK